ncbi:MAG TPA: hypothetical protein VFX49_17050 [Chloroflexota bacterium]|nr:hypothetical protein [Chloroflexota bacterium]
MGPSALRQSLVVICFLLIAGVVMYPYLRDSIRDLPLVVVALLGALVVHAYARLRVRP